MALERKRELMFRRDCMCGCGDGFECRNTGGFVKVSFFRSDSNAQRSSVVSDIKKKAAYANGDTLLREIVMTRDDMLEFRQFLVDCEFRKDAKETRNSSQITPMHLLEDMYAIWLQGSLQAANAFFGNKYHQMFSLTLSAMDRDVLLVHIDKWLAEESVHAIQEGLSPHVDRFSASVDEESSGDGEAGGPDGDAYEEQGSAVDAGSDEPDDVPDNGDYAAVGGGEDSDDAGDGTGRAVRDTGNDDDLDEFDDIPEDSDVSGDISEEGPDDDLIESDDVDEDEDEDGSADDPVESGDVLEDGPDDSQTGPDGVSSDSVDAMDSGDPDGLRGFAGTDFSRASQDASGSDSCRGPVRDVSGGAAAAGMPAGQSERRAASDAHVSSPVVPAASVRHDVRTSSVPESVSVPDRPVRIRGDSPLPRSADPMDFSHVDRSFMVDDPLDDPVIKAWLSSSSMLSVRTDVRGSSDTAVIDGAVRNRGSAHVPGVMPDFDRSSDPDESEPVSVAESGWDPAPGPGPEPVEDDLIGSDSPEDDAPDGFGSTESLPDDGDSDDAPEPVVSDRDAPAEYPSHAHHDSIPAAGEDDDMDDDIPELDDSGDDGLLDDDDGLLEDDDDPDGDSVMSGGNDGAVMTADEDDDAYAPAADPGPRTVRGFAVEEPVEPVRPAAGDSDPIRMRRDRLPARKLTGMTRDLVRDAVSAAKNGAVANRGQSPFGQTDDGE